MADRFRTLYFLKAERFIGKEQHRAGNHRLRHDGFIEIDDLFDLLPIQDALKPLFTPFNPCNELCDFVMLGNPGLCNLFAFKIVPAREANLFQQISGLVGNEIKHPFFLGNPRREHDASIGENRSVGEDSTRPSPWPQDKGLC